jgi:hypothetical protein
MKSSSKIAVLINKDQNDNSDTMMIFANSDQWSIISPKESADTNKIVGIYDIPILAWTLRRDGTIDPVSGADCFISASPDTHLLLSPCGKVISPGGMGWWETKEEFVNAAVGCVLGEDPNRWWSNVPHAGEKTPTSGPFIQK